MIKMTGVNTGEAFTNLVGLVQPAVDGIHGLLVNPYFYGIVLVLLILSLVPGTDD